MGSSLSADGVQPELQDFNIPECAHTRWVAEDAVREDLSSRKRCFSSGVISLRWGAGGECSRPFGLANLCELLINQLADGMQKEFMAFLDTRGCFSRDQQFDVRHPCALAAITSQECDCL